MLNALIALALAAAAIEPDPFLGGPKSDIQALVDAARFGEPGADARISAWLAAHPAAPRDDRKRLLHRLCGDYEIATAHAAAAAACAAAVALGADDKDGAEHSAKLRDTPPIHAIGSARAPLAPNKLGSWDAMVTVNGITAPWIADTGAEITVVSQSLARRIGVRMLEGKVQVGSSTGAVEGSLGVIDLLRIGEASVENTPVLVLPDAQLKIGPLPQIQAILGLPVYRAFRRAAWLDGGKTLALGDAAPTVPPDSPRLYWHAQGLGAPIATARGTRGALLDTGANDTALRSPIHDLLDPATEASATEHRAQVGGAAGVMTVKTMVYPRIALTVAGAPMNLTGVSVDNESQEGAARIGDDVVSRLSALVLDFEHMRVTATPLPAPAAKGPGAGTG